MMSPASQSLTVLIDGRIVGCIKPKWHPEPPASRGKILGQFIPSDECRVYRPVFEAAIELATQYENTIDQEPPDEALWDRLMAAYDRILLLKPSIAEIPKEIIEFAVEKDWEVEITLKTW